MKTNLLICGTAIAAAMLLTLGSCGRSEKNQSEKTTLEVIHSRKSVRHYTDGKVTDEQLLTLAKAGMAAPSAKNAQPWQIMAVTDRAKLDSLGTALPYTKMIFDAPAALVVCGDMTLALEGVSRDYWVQDCSAVTQNILLAAEAIGLGAVWNGIYPVTERVKDVRRILSLPEYIIPLSVIVVGEPAGVETPKVKWDEKKYHINEW